MFSLSRTDILFSLAGILIISEVFIRVIPSVRRHIGILRLPHPRKQTNKHYFSGGPEVLFFPDSGYSCPVKFDNGQDCVNSSCRFLHVKTSLQCLIELLASAVHSLDVCVYIITMDELGDTLIKAHHRGVTVRIITDQDQENASGSQIGKCRADGIPVRSNPPSSALMHHKFVVIDNQVLINGSFNWTKQGVFVNYENIQVTTDESFVSLYMREFERLWNAFEPLPLI